jgi:hypothetical protein
MPYPCPDWLTADVACVLRRDLGTLGTWPEHSWSARDYNAVLELLNRSDADIAPPLGEGIGSAPLPRPVDVAALWEREEAEARRDAYGSFFDRDGKTWIDRSPVTSAMRDIGTAVARNMWDLPQTFREISARDEVQALDEFPDVDARLRQFVCGATAWQSEARHPVYPAWLRPQVVQLLDATFGWSRQVRAQSLGPTAIRMAAQGSGPRHRHSLKHARVSRRRAARARAGLSWVGGEASVEI